MIRRASVLAALLAASLALAACGGGSQQSSGGSGSTSSSTSAPPASSSAEVQRIEIALTDFLFQPQAIAVRRGTPVEIVVTNKGTVRHDFTVEALGLNSGKLEAGQSTTVKFTPGQAGEFRIVCTEAGHDVLGMVGTLTVQ